MNVLDKLIASIVWNKNSYSTTSYTLKKSNFRNNNTYFDFIAHTILSYVNKILSKIYWLDNKAVWFELIIFINISWSLIYIVFV